MLADIVHILICPNCGADLHKKAGVLRCSRGHAFDVARHGYVNLLPGNARTGTADTPAMVNARARFLEAGHYAGIADEVIAAARRAGVKTAARNVGAQAPTRSDPVVDVGAGTGYYLAHAVESLNANAGLALDISTYACRRAARAHARVGAAVCDVWTTLPVRSDSASVVLSIFAPRNAAEMHRILHPEGALIVVTPTADHLYELVQALDLLRVDERKAERLEAQLRGRFRCIDVRPHQSVMKLDHSEVEVVVQMGPSAWHTSAEKIAHKIAHLPDPMKVTISVEVSSYTPE